MRLPKLNRSPWPSIFMLGAAALFASCGSSKNTPVVPPPGSLTGLPTPPVPAPVNSYAGAQSPGAWQFTLDDTKNTFSYQPTTYSGTASAPTSGSFTKANGFLQLGNDAYALEVQGRAAILRPGNATTAPVFAVPQSACYSVSGRLRFLFLGMQTGPDGAVGSAGPTLGYGSMVASTDTTGKSWGFQDLQGNIVAGPTSFSGTCSNSGSSTGIQWNGQTLLNNLWPPNETNQAAPTPTTVSNIWIGPSGFLVADQSDPGASTPTGASVAGLAEPTSALNTTELEAQHFLGFLFEPATVPFGGVSPTPIVTAPVAFGVTSSAVATMTGGAFPNDDVTQTPDSNIQITLGKQNATYNGLYLSVAITVLDPQQNCANYTGTGEKATTGLNAEGYFTCTFAGVAVAGNPEGRYALMVSSYNWAAQLGGAPMQLYLFQQ